MNKQPFEYRTGQTQPAKSSRGLISFLLICIIFLCGLVSVLGLMNIKLLSQLKQTDTQTPVSFAEGDISPVEPNSNSITVGGITVQEMPDLYEQLYDLPEGLYVIDAPENSPVLPGDVLIGFGGSAVGSLAMLNALQETCQAGQQVTLNFYRQEGDYFSHTITFGK